MIILLLRFSWNRSKASELMAAHNAWLQQGFDDGVFLIAGSLQPRLGGVVLAAGTREEVEVWVQQDPFVLHEVVRAEVLEVSPSKVEPRLAFLLE